MLNLNIPEKLFVVSIDDQKGTITPTVRDVLRLGLGGAILAELSLAGRILVQDGRVTMVDPVPIEESLLDECLAMIASDKKVRKISRWIEIFAGNKIVKKVAGRLAERNVIRIEKKHYFWIIPYEIYPQVDASAKYWVKQQLRGLVLAGEKAEVADIILLNLLKACDLLKLVFTRDERKYANKQIRTLVEGEIIGEAVANLLAEIETATMVAVTATLN
jgi:Golgi phosphoprotein 3